MKPTTQVKFTIDADVVTAFKMRCASEGVSMASVVAQWMKAGQPTKSIRANISTRPQRRKALPGIIELLKGFLCNEENYRDGVPEAFQARYETAEHTCEKLSEAIECLEDAY